MALEKAPGFPMKFESPVAVGGPNPEDERARAEQEMEARQGQAREEDYAKRDRILNRLMSAEKPQDVAAAIEMVVDYENVNFDESVDRYTYSAYKRAAIEGQRTFEKGSRGELHDDKKRKEFAEKLTEEKREWFRNEQKDRSPAEIAQVEVNDNGEYKLGGTVIAKYDLGVTYELRKEGIVSKDALIDSNGDLVSGKIRAAGYAISVTEEVREKKGVVEEVHWAIDPKTLQKDPNRSKIIERPEVGRILDTSIHFGTERERLALAKAHEALHKILITSELLQGQAALFDRHRAALEMAVKEFYQYQQYFTNQQHEYFWTEADISKIDFSNPETIDNQEFGRNKSLAYRMNYLVAMCETKEKLEDHLNNTKNFEAILTTSTVDRILQIAKTQGALSGVSLTTDEEKHDAAARFLLGSGLTIDRKKRADGQPVYTIDWMPMSERDPSSVPKPENRADDDSEWKYEQEVKKKGAGAVGVEKAKRGYLSEFGNPYAKSSRDALYVLTERMNQLTGDALAVTEAGRYFWTRGMRDQYGLELYTDEKNFPTGEQLLEFYNTHTDAERKVYFGDLQRLVTLNGEPVGSDLSKLIHTKWWRFKEMIRDRFSGPYLTYDKFNYTNLSFMRLCRTNVPVPDGLGGSVDQTRSIEEQFLGFRSTDGLKDEEPKEMGEIEWKAVRVPDDVKAAVEMSGYSVPDNADGYFWVMNYLTAEDNPEKRFYQMIVNTIERPDNLKKPKSWTDKTKFMVITFHDAVAIAGQWRDWYSKYLSGAKSTDEVKAMTKKAEFMAGRKATRDVEKRKQDWYDGERSTIEYPTWSPMPVKYGGYVNGHTKSGSEELIYLVEGIDPSKPGLAVKYGFMSPEKIGKPPEHQMNFPV